MSKIRLNLLKKALFDYEILLNKNYPTKSIIKIISDFYSLNKEERAILQRGTDKKFIIKKRNKKLIKNTCLIKDKRIYIDFFNVFSTFYSYLKGNFIFIAKDKILRDVSNIGGNNFYKISDLNINLIFEAIYKAIKTLKLKKIIFCFDKPVSFSSVIMKNFINFISEKFKNNCNNYLFLFLLCKNADDFLITFPKKNDIVITSDSFIIDNTEAKIFDICKFYIIEIIKKRILKI